jgi:hypothetical protein
MDWTVVLRANRVEVSGVNHFLGPSQYTVFLQCDGSRLKHVWAKNDYGYHPHLTLYDGSDPRIASDLESVACRHEFRWSFRADKLQALVGTSEWERARDQQRLDLLLAFRPAGRDLVDSSSASAADAVHLPWSQRIVLIEQLFKEAAEAATA